MRARQKVSRAGVELIKSFEGLRQTAARLPDGRWTLGYGHTFSAREGARVTQEDADALLRFDLLPIVDALNNMVLIPLNQNTFDALVSFCFNIGVDNFAASTVLKRVNEGRMTEAALAMDAWRSAEFNGQTYVLAPLIRRRAAEKNLFLTPEDVAGNAPTLLVRPVEDGRNEALTSSPSELTAPDRGGILSAYPVGQPDAAPTPAPAPAPAPQVVQPQIPLPYASPYATPIAAQPFAQPAAVPVERQVIDLAQFTPRPVAPEPAPIYPTPSETVVEQLPHGLMSSSALRETPAAFAAPVPDAEPVMSADTQAALARAQEEQRLREDSLRQAQAAAAARSAEDARLREVARLQEEARLHEQQRMEAQRAEQDRIDAAQREQARLEQERLEQERLEQVRAEQERAEQARVEQARLEHDRQAREEQAKLEQAKLEQERLEQQRLERERAESARLESERLEREKAVPAVSAEDAEKVRKAEAAAALMRLYSPYGSGALGRPLGALTPTAAPAPAPVVTPTPMPEARPAAVAMAEPRFAPDLEPQEFSNHSIISPSAAASTPIDVVARGEDMTPEPAPKVVPFAPVISASAMPAPVITALNPYARPLPADTVVEVPRPAPVDLSSAPAHAQAQATPEAALNWREQLQRPLPSDYRPPETAQPEASLLRANHATRFDDMYDEDNEDWTMDGGRIALSSEVMEEEGASWWTMIVSTFWWIFISVLGLASLGVAAAAYYKSKDMTVIRNGFFHDYMMLSVITATVGILLVSVSVWLIMRRLGGLKD